MTYKEHNPKQLKFSTKDDYFESPVLGKTRNATEEEAAGIQKAVDETAITVFQMLNKMLNSRGLCITIDALPE